MLGDCIFTLYRRQALPFPQNRFRHLTRHLTPVFAKKTLVTYIEQSLAPPFAPRIQCWSWSWWVQGACKKKAGNCWTANDTVTQHWTWGGGGTATNCIRLYVFQRFFCKHRYTHRVCWVCYMCAHVLAPEATPHVRLTRLTCKTWKILYVLHILHSEIKRLELDNF